MHVNLFILDLLNSNFGKYILCMYAFAYILCTCMHVLGVIVRAVILSRHQSTET